MYPPFAAPVIKLEEILLLMLGGLCRSIKSGSGIFLRAIEMRWICVLDNFGGLSTFTSSLVDDDRLLVWRAFLFRCLTSVGKLMRYVSAAARM